MQSLIDACIQDDDKLYLCVSSPTIKDKPVQIRPWRLSDADFVLDASLPLDPRKTVFVGGVPRPLKAGEQSRAKRGGGGAVEVPRFPATILAFIDIGKRLRLRR